MRSAARCWQFAFPDACSAPSMRIILRHRIGMNDVSIHERYQNVDLWFTDIAEFLLDICLLSPNRENVAVSPEVFTQRLDWISIEQETSKRRADAFRPAGAAEMLDMRALPTFDFVLVETLKVLQHVKLCSWCTKRQHDKDCHLSRKRRSGYEGGEFTTSNERGQAVVRHRKLLQTPWLKR